MMGNSIVLNNLIERNNSLRSLLIHDQLKYGTYHFGYFKKYLLVINEYKKYKSFFKVSSVVNISHQELIKWYVQGQMGNPKFRRFYLAIDGINSFNDEDVDESVDGIENGNADEDIVPVNAVNEEKGYMISQYGDGWCYKTFIDGEKIFIISSELKTLKEKVKAKHLPLN